MESIESPVNVFDGQEIVGSEMLQFFNKHVNASIRGFTIYDHLKKRHCFEPSQVLFLEPDKLYSLQAFVFN